MQKSETKTKVRTRITLDRDLYTLARHVAADEGPHVDVRDVIARAVEEYVRREAGSLAR